MSMANQNDFTLCPQCGSKKIQNVNLRKWRCPDCGFDLYNNVAAAVGMVIADDANNVLFERRAKEPRKGFLALPGGFVDPDETAEAACMRESREEIGAEPTALRYLCSFPNTYDYKGIRYKTCDLFFEAALPPDAHLHAQEGEVTAFEHIPVRTEAELDALPLAFESARKTLRVWLARRAAASATKAASGTNIRSGCDCAVAVAPFGSNNATATKSAQTDNSIKTLSPHTAVVATTKAPSLATERTQ